MDADKKTRTLSGRTVFLLTLGFFGVVIGVNMVMLTFAIRTLPGTEVDSAYRASLAYNMEIAAARAQASREWNVKAHIDRTAGGAAVVLIEARDGAGVPVTQADFFARLERPADKRADRKLALVQKAPGSYRGEADNIDAGQWNLVIEAARGAERLFLSSSRVILSQQ